jgi:serine/threonine-protein kinase
MTEVSSFTATRQERIAKSGPVVAERYQCLERLGTGGAGVVFKALDLKTKDTIALKILAPLDFKDPTARARFEKEVMLTRDFNHPNLVPVFDFGTTETGQSFLTMEYVDGGTLKDLIEKNEATLAFDKLLFILRDIARGVSYAHEKGVVHRDLKPENILLTTSGEAKVADFGLARQMDSGMTITKSAETVGTPYYMSPEQFRNHRVDERADIYSFGLIAYEAVTGERAFPCEDGNFQTIAMKHFMEPLPDVPRERKDIPRWFRILLGVCAEKKPEHRYRSMDDIVDILEIGMRKMALLPPLPVDPNSSFIQKVLRRIFSTC